VRTWLVWGSGGDCNWIWDVVEIAAMAIRLFVWAPFTRAQFNLALLLGSLSLTYSLMVVARERLDNTCGSSERRL
jgi:hypothetical protein